MLQPTVRILFSAQHAQDCIQNMVFAQKLTCCICQPFKGEENVLHTHICLHACTHMCTRTCARACGTALHAMKVDWNWKNVSIHTCVKSWHDLEGVKKEPLYHA